MDVTGLLIVMILAQPTPLLGLSRVYHLVEQLKTWTEAQSYCREKFADLATVETQEDWEAVREIVAADGIFAWIGLYEDVNSWKWSPDNTPLYRSENTDLGAWFVFNADNDRSVEHCAVFLNNLLSDDNCASAHRSVCYDEPSNTYIPVWSTMSWLDAQSHCREHYTDLATMKTEQEQNSIKSVVDNVSGWWIGLTRDTWKWSDQSNSSFLVWAPGEPDHGHYNCGGAYLPGFGDAACDHSAYFICSAPIRKRVKVALKVKGADLNDAVLQEAVLKHLENQLREQGIHQPFQLSWAKQPNGKILNTDK